MNRYWIAVACAEHVERAIKDQVIQVCHGKQAPLKRMNAHDGIIYYSPTVKFQGEEKCRCFTALGMVTAEEPYLFKMTQDFIPWRRKVIFIPSRSVPIEPLITRLTFIVNKQKWGYPFKRGFFEILKEDFDLIKEAMTIRK